MKKIIVAMSLLSGVAHASVFQHCKDRSLSQCQEVTKGEAIIIKAKDAKAIIVKVDNMILSSKGTLVAE